MTSIMITGGTGALGTALVKAFVCGPERAERVVVFSRGEVRQHQMAQEFAVYADNLRFFIGDVRDRDRLKRAMRGVDVVIHAAALKRIEVGFYNPIEMVKTNVLGAINVIEAAQDSNVLKVVGVSTDKAFQPVSPYGHSKAMAEALFLNANNTSGKGGTEFNVVRYGNVWNSTGSVVPLWREKMRNGFTINITDPDCTRFFMRMNEAVCLICQAICASKGKLLIPTLPAYRLGDLAAAMGIMDYAVIGLPAWEKKHESMEEGNSSDIARRMTVAELKQELEKTP